MRDDACAAFGTQWRSGFSDEWGALEGRVLQQWWEPPAIHYPEGWITFQDKGEWRDIELAEEE